MEDLTIEGWYEHHLHAHIIGDGIEIVIGNEVKVMSKTDAKRLGEWLIKSSEEQ